jgi:hypothetical protein
MVLFLLYCCFNGCYKSRNIGILTLRSAKKKLRTMLHSAELKKICYVRLRASLCNSVWNLSQKFSCRLHTMLHNAELRLRIMHHCAESLTVCLQISLRIRNHMQKWFNLFINDQSGFDWWKKTRVENLVRLFLSIAVPAVVQLVYSIFQ